MLVAATAVDLQDTSLIQQITVIHIYGYTFTQIFVSGCPSVHSPYICYLRKHRSIKLDSDI